MRGAWLIVLLATFAGCNSGNVVPRDRVSEKEIDGLREQSGPPLYYAGRSVSGLPLTEAEGSSSSSDGGFFAYGTCELPEGEGGCALPIEIQLFQFEPAQWEAAEGCVRLPSLRGVPTARHDGIVLFTDSMVVTVYARDAAEERQVVAELRGLNVDVEKGAPLPPPKRNVRELVARACG
jgi:hypothetical protein